MIFLGKPHERKKAYVPHCYICKRDVDIVVDDGQFGLCEECARHESNRIYDNLLRIYEADEEIYRKAFLKYGWEDFACTLDEEKNNG